MTQCQWIIRIIYLFHYIHNILLYYYYIVFITVFNIVNVLDTINIPMIYKTISYITIIKFFILQLIINIWYILTY